MAHPVRRQILIVTDIDPQAFSIQRLLAERAYTVRIAKTGDEALRTLQCEPRVGLVIWDLAMRQINSLDWINRILRLSYSTDDEVLPPPKIIALATPGSIDTQLSRHIAEQVRLVIGANFLHKPIEPEVLLERVASLLGSAKEVAKPKRQPDSTRGGPEPFHSDVLRAQFTELHDRLLRLDQNQEQISERTRSLGERMSQLERPRER